VQRQCGDISLLMLEWIIHLQIVWELSKTVTMLWWWWIILLLAVVVWQLLMFNFTMFWISTLPSFRLRTRTSAFTYIYVYFRIHWKLQTTRITSSTLQHKEETGNNFTIWTCIEPSVVFIHVIDFQTSDKICALLTLTRPNNKNTA
jgi:hypothetical protein